MKIGVISDTHGFFDPHLKEALVGVEVILHGGDVGSQSVLDELSEIAPVRAVRGNVDPPGLNLPPSLTLSFGRLQVQMMHILPVPQYEVQEWSERVSPVGKPPERSEAFSKTFDDETGVVVFGHSHAPCLLTLDCRLFFNPGSAGKRRFSLPRCCGLLEVFPDCVRASIKRLEQYRGNRPPRIQMDFDE